MNSSTLMNRRTMLAASAAFAATATTLPDSLAVAQNPHNMNAVKGLDLLGLAHPNFPWRMVLSQMSMVDRHGTPYFPGPTMVGAFAWGVFGNRASFENRLREVCLLPNVQAVRVQAWWDDNKHVQPYDDRLVRIPHLKEVARVMHQFSLEFPRMNFFLSHTCEYFSRNTTAVHKRIDVIRQFAPRVTPVNNPQNGQGLPAGPAVLEYHGDTTMGAGQGISLDGKDATDINVTNWMNKNRGALYRLLWIHSFNLRIKNGPFVPRPQRTVRVTKQEMAWLRQWF
jgi:hypothetical protein